MRKTFWLATLAYIVPTFPLGYVWHLVIFRDVYGRLAMYRDEVIIPLGLTAMLIQSVIFAWAYPRLFNTGRTAWVGSALRAFAVFGVLAWSFTTLPVAAKYRMSSVPTFLELETGFTLVQFAIVAPLLALVCRKAADADSAHAPVAVTSHP